MCQDCSNVTTEVSSAEATFYPGLGTDSSKLSPRSKNLYHTKQGGFGGPLDFRPFDSDIANWLPMIDFVERKNSLVFLFGLAYIRHLRYHVSTL